MGVSADKLASDFERLEGLALGVFGVFGDFAALLFAAALPSLADSLDLFFRGVSFGVLRGLVAFAGKGLVRLLPGVLNGDDEDPLLSR